MSEPKDSASVASGTAQPARDGQTNVKSATISTDNGSEQKQNTGADRNANTGARPNNQGKQQRNGNNRSSTISRPSGAPRTNSGRGAEKPSTGEASESSQANIGSQSRPLQQARNNRNRNAGEADSRNRNWNSRVSTGQGQAGQSNRVPNSRPQQPRQQQGQGVQSTRSSVSQEPVPNAGNTRNSDSRRGDNNQMSNTRRRNDTNNKQRRKPEDSQALPQNAQAQSQGASQEEGLQDIGMPAYPLPTLEDAIGRAPETIVEASIPNRGSYVPALPSIPGSAGFPPEFGQSTSSISMPAFPTGPVVPQLAAVPTTQRRQVSQSMLQNVVENDASLQAGSSSEIVEQPTQPFQFGAKRRSGHNISSNRNSLLLMSPDLNMEPYNSVQTPEQVILQQQIDALQQQQHDLASLMINTKTSPGHKRFQSQQISPAQTMGQFSAPNTVITPQQFGLETSLPNQALNHQQLSNTNKAGGHNRRLSLQMGNNANGAALGSFSFPSRETSAEAEVPPQAANKISGGQVSGGGHHRRTSGGNSGVIDWRNNPPQVGDLVDGPDLAQAQAQLASLSAFRLAAGAGGHSRALSFALPNPIANHMAAALMTGTRPEVGVSQQQHAFQLQLQTGTTGMQRKSLFAPYLPHASLPPLLTAGKLVVGTLRINKRNRSDAYVSNDVLDADIYICGSKDRNRALEGDLVAVELLDVDEVWNSKKEKEDKKRRKEASTASETSRAIGAANAVANKKRDDVEVEGQGLTLVEDEEVTDETKPQYAGHVVAVIERTPGQMYSGTLGLLRPSSAATKEKQDAERREREGGLVDRSSNKAAERPKIVWFKPTDKRVPLIAIPTEQTPSNFLESPGDYADRLFVATIKRWPITSLHPFGTLMDEIGRIGDVEVETSALLKDANAAPTEAFPDNVLKNIPADDWQIPESELEQRKDLRNHRIFSIDPPTARDLDDCLSIERKDDGTFDIGIHIADVSYFVKHNSPLDREARKRGTTVYLVQRAVTMLPSVLCESLCSLVPNQDRLAFSVILNVNKEGYILNSWLGKTIIRSCAQLSYDQAQHVLENGELEDVKIHNEQTPKDVASDIQLLNSVAQALRSRRFNEGCLRIDQIKLSFTLDKSGYPVDCRPYEIKAANNLVEEFMLLANITVSQQIAAGLPEQALLRRHDKPMQRRLEQLANRGLTLGAEISISSAGALQKSMESIQEEAAKRTLQGIAVRGMHRARYICSGAVDVAKYQHYALNVPLYTHFTSPIRRYADIIVHRQLDAILNTAGNPEAKLANLDRDNVAKIAQQCNVKRDAATLAQEASDHLFLCLLISRLTEAYGPVVRAAQVVDVLDAAFDVVIPEFGVEKRIHLDQVPLREFQHDPEARTLDLHWQDDNVVQWLAQQQQDNAHLQDISSALTRSLGADPAPPKSANDLFSEDDAEAEEEDGEITERNPSDAKVEYEKTSSQYIQSAAKAALAFDGIDKATKVQKIRELAKLAVVITADMTKSPPVIRVIACNPFEK